MSDKYDIVKFDRKINFGLWQVKMRAILVGKRCVKALVGKANKPATLTDEQFDDMDERAVSLIHLSLKDEVLREVYKEKTAAALWLRLEQLYMTKSISNRLLLLKKLEECKLKSGESLKRHLDEFDGLVMDLKNVDVKIEEEQLAIKLLCSLPSEYVHFRETVLYGKDEISLEEIKNALLQREVIETELISNGEESQGDGLVARSGGSSRNSGQTNSRWKNVICHICKEKGHVKRFCPTIGGKTKEDTTEKTKGEVGVVFEDTSDDSECDALTACDSGTKIHESWILDSGCSYHISPNRAWFCSYKAADGVVLLGNNNSCKVVGIGSIMVKMFDGVVRKLQNVRHVPELKRNLISLGTLDSRGYNISIVDGELLANKGDLVVLKGKKVGTLYELLGSTVVGEVSVAKRMTEDHMGLIGKTKRARSLSSQAWLGFRKEVIRKTASVSNYSLNSCFGGRSTYACVNKMESKAIKSVSFVGYGTGGRFRLWNLVASKVLMSRDVALLLRGKKCSAELIHKQVELDGDGIKGVDLDLDGNNMFDEATQIESPVQELVVLENQTWELGRPPPVEKEVSHKWVYKFEDGTPKFGVDYNEVISPVVKHSWIHDLLSIEVMKDLALEVEIFMHRPGFVVEGKKGHVCLLERSLVMKQSTRQRDKRFDTFMVTHGCARSEYGDCVYLMACSDGTLVYLVYVDDILVAAVDNNDASRVKWLSLDSPKSKDDGSFVLDSSAYGSMGDCKSDDGYIGRMAITEVVMLTRLIAKFKMFLDLVGVTSH